MKIRIGVVVVIQLVALFAFSSAAFAASPAPETTTHPRQQGGTKAAARHHQRHRIVRRPADTLHYYGRPVLYAPAPYAPFLPFISDGWKRY